MSRLHRLVIRFRVWYGDLCPEHLAPTYFDESYGKMRCSVTDQPVIHERRRINEAN